MKSSARKISFGTSVVVLIICLVLITGSTFSLFTSESKVNIAVTSGEVDVVATIDTTSLVLYSKGVMQEGMKFENGGKAGFDNENGKLTLTNITPGDKAVFSIDVTNNSTVDVQYRVKWVVNGELVGALVATVDEKPIVNGTSEWALLNPGQNIESLKVSVELPLEVGNDYQKKDATIDFIVEAVQANGTDLYGKTIVSDLAGLIAALEDPKDNNVIAITTPIEIKDEVELDLNGKTVEGSLVLVDGANLTIKNGVLINNDPKVSAIQVNGGKLTIDDVEITSARHALRIEGDGSEVVINGGKYVAQDSAGVTQHALNVGGDKNCTVTINGGEFIGPADTASDSGSAVTVKAGSTVTINGGNFSGGKNNTLSGAGTLTVKGGTFDQNPSAYVADGYEAVKNEDGTWTVKFPQTSLEALIKNAQSGDTVEIPAGTYTFPASLIKEGVTLNCAPGTVFEGTSSLYINGATVIGATFSNTTGTAVDGTINGTFKDCIFTGKNALRWCYAGETVVFENCVFDGDTYGVHFDDGANDVVFTNCTFSGFNAFGGAITNLVLDDCTFQANGKSIYNGANLWGNTELKDCTFVFDGSVEYEWVDACGDNKTYSFTNCVVVDAEGNKAGVETVVGNYGVGNTIIINGETLGLVSDEVVLDADLASGKDVVLSGDLSFNASETTANSGYGATGVSVKGSVLDGNGHSIGINNWGTWDAAVHTTGGTIKNLTINSGMRGIFMCSATADVYIDNVVIDGTIYTFNSDGGSKEYGVYISNSTLCGWTSFSNVHKEVVFTNCTFGEGQGYAFCRPYNAPTKFEDCVFEEGFEFDTTQTSDIAFINCYYGDTLITAENAATLGNEGTTFFCNGLNGITINGVKVDNVTNNEELNAAIEAGIPCIVLMPGEYGTIVAKSDITYIGTPGAKVDAVNLNGASNVTLKNINFDAANAQLVYNTADQSPAQVRANIFSDIRVNVGARNIVIDGCTFNGKFDGTGAYFTAAIAFTGRGRNGGVDGNITITNCTFDTEGATYDIYGYYTAYTGTTFTIENNTFKDNVTAGPIFLNRLKTNEAIVVKGNTFETTDSIENSVGISGDTGWNPTLDAADNTFGG